MFRYPALIAFVTLLVAGGAIFARAADPAPAPAVTGKWTGTWGDLSMSDDGEPRLAKRYPGPMMALDCVVEKTGDRWDATFEGECGRPYKYTIRMKGRQSGKAVLFNGTVDLGEKDGGVYDWIGKATDTSFVGFYTSQGHQGSFQLRRK